MKMNKYSLTKFNIILVGDCNVGKSSLMKRYATGEYEYNSLRPTIGVGDSCKREANGCRLTIFDTSGQEKFKSIAPNYYRRAHGVILVFDVTDRMSFIEIPVWRAEVNKYTKNKPIFLLVGNKCEDEGSRVVGRREARDMAEIYSMEYIETSAKDGTNVEEIFETIAEKTREAVQVHERSINIERDEVTVNMPNISDSNKSYPCKC